MARALAYCLGMHSGCLMCMHASKLRPVSDQADVGLYFAIPQMDVGTAMQRRRVTQPWLTVCCV